MSYLMPLGLTEEEEYVLTNLNTTDFYMLEYHEGIERVYNFIAEQEGLFQNVVVSNGGNKVAVQRLKTK